MEGLLILLLIFMFFAGCIQVLTGLITVFVSKSEVVRRHMSYYLAGVVVYFLTLLAMAPFDHANAYPVLAITFFFAGATSLFIYQIIILARRDLLR